MLARYLRTSQQPIRYAMDPAHAQAIRNYLALTTRAYDVPGLYQQARPHLPGGREGELLHHLFSAMIGEHDPDALAAFLDAHQDFTGQPTPSDFGVHSHPTLNLLQMLSGLHQAVIGNHRYGDQPIVSQFTPKNLADPALRPVVQRGLNINPMGRTRTIGGMLQQLFDTLHGESQVQPGRRLHEPFNAFTNYMQHLRSAHDPTAAVPAHDAAAAIRDALEMNSATPYTHRDAAEATMGTRRLIADHIIPHLLS